MPDEMRELATLKDVEPTDATGRAMVAREFVDVMFS
jgi:hypothetical protein